MDLLTYISDTGRRAALARACRTSPRYLWQIATRWQGRQAGIGLAKKIHEQSARLGPEQVPLAAIRPDVWGEPAGQVSRRGRRHSAQPRLTP